MRTYSSSSLKPFLNWCPKALDYYQSGAPRDRTELDRGVCAHAILEHAAGLTFNSADEINELADRITEELITHGREFRGEKQAPLIPQSAYEGRDIAIQYLTFNDAPPAGLSEVELWMDADGGHNDAQNPRYVALVDLVYETEIGEEDDAVTAVVVRDYKTAWSTNENETETLQMRGQAALADLHFPDAAVIIREAVNVRTGAVYRSETIRDDDGRAELARWRRDILAICNAADANAGQRMARPGYGCLSCWYSATCDYALAAQNNVDDIATAYVAAKARAAELSKLCQKAAKIADGDFTVTPGGRVGYRKAERRIVTESAPRLITDTLGDSVTPDSVCGLLMQMKLGVTQVDAIAKTLDDASKEDLLSGALDKKISTKFDVWGADK